MNLCIKSYISLLFWIDVSINEYTDLFVSSSINILSIDVVNPVLTPSATPTSE